MSALKVEAKLLKRVLAAVAPAVGDDETRPSLFDRILIERVKKGVRFVATDGHRLHAVTLKGRETPASRQLISPRALDLAIRAAKGPNQEVEVLGAPDGAPLFPDYVVMAPKRVEPAGKGLSNVGLFRVNPRYLEQACSAARRLTGVIIFQVPLSDTSPMRIDGEALDWTFLAVIMPVR